MVSASLTRSQTVTALTVAILLGGTVLFGAAAQTDDPSELGDGNATVASVSVPTEDTRITDGRFGTGMSYLRVPAATVDVDGVDGRPRLLYRLEVPGLGIDTDATRQLRPGATGRYRLDVGAVALDPATVTNESYSATLTVRIQSFTADTTVFRRTVSVEVEP